MGPDQTPSRLRILHRSSGGDNAKPRPPYYSKLLALASLLRAADALTPAPELTFLNDGPMPAETLAAMEARGEVVAVRRGGSNRRSYQEMICDEAARGGADDELIWLAEDDYLYAPDALAHLVAAAGTQHFADYFTLYGSRSIDLERSGRRMYVHPEPAGGCPDGPLESDDVAWYRAVSTTLTFGIRRGALRQDLRLLTTFMLTGGSWDNSTFLALQGYYPFGAAEILRDLLPVRSAPVSRWARLMARGAIRTATLPVALRRPARRRVLLGSDPELVLHMESPDLAPHRASRRTAAVDWAAIAHDTADWAGDHGIPVRLHTAPTADRREALGSSRQDRATRPG